MGKKPKIRPTSSRVASALMNPTKLNDTQKVSFNFKYLHTKVNKFDYCVCATTYFNTLLARFCEVSRMTRKEMTIINKKPLRCHQIDFLDDNVTEDGFGNLGEDLGDDAWQFQLTSNEHGRVHGFFIDSIFYIVWLDPKHELYA